jgi:hypothetical protein
VTTLQPHQQRMLDERQELAERVEKLDAFHRSPAFKELSIDERCDMREQYIYMLNYLFVLNRRIARWNAGTLASAWGGVAA